MSEILFLGTGGAGCDLSKKDELLRRHSAALINCELMVDCGGHIFDFAETIGNEALYSGVTDIIITHNHSDHFCKESVLNIAENQKIRVGCDRQIINTIGEHPNIEYVPFSPFKTINMGKYEITPVLANHHIVADGDSYAFHHIIKTPDGKEIYYGLDGAWFLRPSWEEMKKHKFDVMVLDCTVGDQSNWRLFEHNTIPMLRMMIEGIQMENMLSESGVLVASHLANFLHAPQEETIKILKEIGMITAYDGMKMLL